MGRFIAPRGSKDSFRGEILGHTARRSSKVLLLGPEPVKGLSAARGSAGAVASAGLAHEMSQARRRLTSLDKPSKRLQKELKAIKKLPLELKMASFYGPSAVRHHLGAAQDSARRLQAARGPGRGGATQGGAWPLASVASARQPSRCGLASLGRWAAGGTLLVLSRHSAMA